MFSEHCCDLFPENLLGVVSGVGGCGKSFLIEVVAQQIRFLYNSSHIDGDAVHIVAPTGLAAYNIGGTTIHRKLKLPVQHGRDQKFQELIKDSEKLLRVSELI